MDGSQAATFGLGCFWCAEAAFSGVKGIIGTRVGYMGGTLESPTYEQVCSGGTGHIEVVEVRYSPEEMTFQGLLEIFWSAHNPVVSGHCEGDQGEQYWSVIFYHGEEQKALAEESKRRAQASGKFRGRISTAIRPASVFWPAEEHHQCYIRRIEGARS
jgi:peptide-methionine (S)-S-oxide reductase